MGLSLRHNKGKTQNIKHKWITRMGQPLKNFITKEELKRFFFGNFYFERNSLLKTQFDFF